MKKILIISLMSFFIACNTNVKKDASLGSENPTKSKKVQPKKNRSSGDYGTLLGAYTCNMTVEEIAKVLEVAETDLSVPDNGIPNECLFILKGFGVNVLNGGSRLRWGPSQSTKSQNKKEIASYLKRKKEGLKIMGMDIQLAETGDCYLAYQPAHGRLIIYNEQYDQAFLINYGRRSANSDRTKEQHEELKEKMTDLANYLLKKHRK